MSVHLKMNVIYSNFSTVHQHIEDCFEKTIDSVPEMQSWQKVQPFAHFFDKVTFTTEELVLVYSLEIVLVFNYLLNLSRVHSAIRNVIVLYSEKRLDLENEMTKLAKVIYVSQTKVSTEFDTDDVKRLRPQMYKLNSLIDRLREMVKIETEVAYNTLTELHDQLKKHQLISGTIEFV
jgi:hypothetical protein